MTSLEDLRAQFEFFAWETGEAAPFYRDLALSVAAVPGLMRLSDEAMPGQRRANLLFAAIHYLVLRGDEHPLAALYHEAAGGHPDGFVAFPVFEDFCRTHREALLALIRGRMVQTNEVQRCAYILPGLAATQAAVGRRPLALIDAGTSAGLHLLFDRYSYRYSDGRAAGDAASSVRIDCEVRGELPLPVPDGMPLLASRVGVDINPVDIRDEDAALWLRALVWPEQPERAERLSNAIAIAREEPPTVISGDIFDVLPGLVRETPRDAVPCIHHSHVLAHFPAPLRERFTEELLPSLGAERDIAWLANEGTTMELTTWIGGVATRRVLANRPAHGEWIEWLAG